MSNNEDVVAKIKEILETLRPYLNMDGGDVEFIKYDDERLVFISNKNTEYFCILLFYFSDTYTKMKVRYYSFALNTYKLSKEMSAYFWKDYLLYLPSYNDVRICKWD